VAPGSLWVSEVDYWEAFCSEMRSAAGAMAVAAAEAAAAAAAAVAAEAAAAEQLTDTYGVSGKVCNQVPPIVAAASRLCEAMCSMLWPGRRDFVAT
jgi:hypothetical protein